MKYTWATATHVGHVRAGNEDSVYPAADGSGSGPAVVGVADGMGGHAYGEVASRIAIETAAASAESGESVETSVRRGNSAVNAAIEADPKLAGMGTTLTLAVADEAGMLHVGHVGDSRIYLHRLGKLRQLSTDHTLVNELIQRGQLTPAQAESHPRRHMLTNVVGMEEVAIESIEIQLQDGDRLLLCSDGLSGMIPDTAIARVLGSADDPADAAWSLIEAANAAGGIDNTSVVVVDVST